MSSSPSKSTGRPRFDIGDIAREHGPAVAATTTLTVAQKRVLSAIACCRTAALGGHVERCSSCDYEHFRYHSCRNRHCPKCQALAQEKWIAERSRRLLPVHHFHIVFTLPRELRALARHRPKAILSALFAVTNETLADIARSRFDAQLGMTLVLHTWTRDLRFHPHIHALVTAGGLSLDGSRWSESGLDYFAPVKTMGKLMRGKMLARIRELHEAGTFDRFDDFRDPEGFDRLMRSLARHESWVVYAKKPFRKVDHVLAYLGRYTHRVAISNSRLVDVTKTHVTFRTKNGGEVTLSAVQFLRRFLDHVLPDSFHKIRHFGLYSSTNARPGAKLDHARALLPPDHRAPHGAVVIGWEQWLKAHLDLDVTVCPLCGDSLLRLPISRAPPTSKAA